MTITEQRLELIKSILDDDTIAAEENEVLHMLLQERVSQDAVSEHDQHLTFGQRAADSLAKFAGSWVFIIIFFSILLLWISINAVFLVKPYDVYPFILLNLILSCLAAIQAPVIMMSQNRQEQKDRERAKNDYKVNLKAEIIIEDIHQKLDAIIEHQLNLAERLNTMEQPKP
ncbi:MAG TPA: DUF1003 domain-containing protein [Clostridia bacterium]